MKVLFLTAWYPHRYDAMAGLFVRKHAEAVSRFADVEVLYVHFDAQIQKTEFVEQQFGTVREVLIYVPERKGFLSKIRNYFAYFSALFAGLKRLQRPDIAQVNVIEKSALAALWLKWRYRIPYVVVEHFSRYLPQNFSYKGFWNKRMSETVVKNASCVMPVSNLLGERMQNLGLKNANYQRINNVVDDFFFQQKPKQKRTKKRILHISCFDEAAKNVSGILRATKTVSLQRSDFELIIVGTGKDFNEIQDWCRTLNFPENTVQFTGEQMPEQVCAWLQQSDFFLLFSNYENAPVVISEALAVGLPVLATNAGGIPEMISAETGILITPKDENELVAKINFMLDNFQNFDRDIIRKSGEHYSYEAVGNMLKIVYENSIKTI